MTLELGFFKFNIFVQRLLIFSYACKREEQAEKEEVFHISGLAILVEPGASRLSPEGENNKKQ